MADPGKSGWWIPAGLVVLSVIPIVAGAVRAVQLASGAEVTPESARFFASPLPIALHLASMVVYCLAGALQFAPGFRRRHTRWHRAAGRILVPCGLVAALSGLWMTQFYPPADPAGSLPASFDGPALYGIRLLAGAAMAACLCLGVAAVRRRSFRQHGAWMVRAYALGLGAGTQVITHLPWFVFPGIRGELTRTLCMGAGWAINVAVAEWLIARRRVG